MNLNFRARCSAPPALERPRPTTWVFAGNAASQQFGKSTLCVALCSTRARGAGSVSRDALRPDAILVISPAPCRSKARLCRRTGDRAQRCAGVRPRASRARWRPHPLTAASRLIPASLAPSSTCRFVESNLRGARCAAPDRASGHQVARFTRDCGGFLEGYRILTKTWSGARPGSRAVVVTGLELNETLDTRNPPGGGLV